LEKSNTYDTSKQTSNSEEENLDIIKNKIHPKLINHTNLVKLDKLNVNTNHIQKAINTICTSINQKYDKTSMIASIKPMEYKKLKPLNNNDKFANQSKNSISIKENKNSVFSSKLKEKLEHLKQNKSSKTVKNESLNNSKLRSSSKSSYKH